MISQWEELPYNFRPIYFLVLGPSENSKALPAVFQPMQALKSQPLVGSDGIGKHQPARPPAAIASSLDETKPSSLARRLARRRV
jgi:hypothetical protein